MLSELRKKPSRFIIGLMSGSSCDGVDAALIRVRGTGRDLAFKLIKFQIFPYTPSLRTRLLAPRMDAHDICLLNSELGERMAEATLEIMNAAKEDDIPVDFIASHGHTLAHIRPGGNTLSGTLQVGESAIIAERTGRMVVSDFRQRDMAAGGQGAPLVPYVDWLLFHRQDRTVICLNIGGIANVTVVPPEFEKVLAFDTGPGNMIIDGAMRLLSRGRQEMDTNGALAAQGVVIDEFLEYLLAHPYFDKKPPKSTGKEEFGVEAYLRDALASRNDLAMKDLIATITSAVAYSIVRAYNRFIKPDYDVTRMIVSGGGAHNKTLMYSIQQGMQNVLVRTSDKYNIPSDAREAISFAILGNETVCGTPANVPHATGARHPVLLGKITLP